MATYSSTLAWNIPWTEEPGRLQSMGSQRVRWLNDFTFTFHFHALEKEMATHSSVLAWRIPGTGEPGGLPSLGSHRVRHDWSDLAAAAWISCGESLFPWVFVSSKFWFVLCIFLLKKKKRFFLSCLDSSTKSLLSSVHLRRFYSSSLIYPLSSIVSEFLIAYFNIRNQFVSSSKLPIVWGVTVFYVPCAFSIT